MNVSELEKMWDKYSNIQTVENKLTFQFYNWVIGTNWNEILKWFNRKLPDGILLQDFTQPQLEMLWDYFGDIPINNDDEIEEDFYCWEKGTYRFDIWHWFDEKLPNGLVVDFNLK